MFEVKVIAAEAHGAMLFEPALTDGSRAKERASLTIQALVRVIGTGGFEPPFSRLVRREPYAPGSAAVPKPEYRE